MRYHILGLASLISLSSLAHAELVCDVQLSRYQYSGGDLTLEFSNGGRAVVESGRPLMDKMLRVAERTAGRGHPLSAHFHDGMNNCEGENRDIIALYPLD